MFREMKKICSDIWNWRYQIFSLAWFDLKKTCRGAVFGWLWLVIRPIVYVGVFWFALEIGLRAGSTVGDYPFMLWLAAGVIPWFFMSDMFVVGSNLFARYPYLVNRLKFPLPAISCFYGLSIFIIQLLLVSAFLLLCSISGFSFDVHLLQLPFVMLLMYIFFVLWSILASPISAISKDFAQLIKALNTPLFWISGAIFNVASIGVSWLQTLLYLNPVSFFITAFRACICDKFWIWEKPELLIPFLLVFLVTFVFAILSSRRLGGEVADVL